MAKNNVDGVYSADPELDKNAINMMNLSYLDVIKEGLSSDGFYCFITYVWIMIFHSLYSQLWKMEILNVLFWVKKSEQLLGGNNNAKTSYC